MVTSKNIEYFDAIEKRAELSRYWFSDTGIHILNELYKITNGNDKTKPAGGNIQAMKEGLNPALTIGETFFWSEAILDIICEAASTIPSHWVLTGDDLPTPYGFFWLAKPIVILKDVKDTDSDIQIKAIAWTTWLWEGDKTNHIICPLNHKLNSLTEDDLILIFYFIKFKHDASEELPIPLPWSAFMFGSTLAEMGNHSPKNPYGSIADWGWAERYDENTLLNPLVKDVKINLFATMLTFLQQKILMPVRQSPPRPFRRRAEREHRKLPLISIIKLRPIAYHKGEGEHRDLEYHYQWLVRGHWRDQWYPSLQRNQPIWIAPYIKGPPDKPFKGAKRLFAVVR